MTANVEAMVREAIRAYRSGKKAEARTLLEKAVELDQYNEQAWMWLSAVVETPEEQRTCLENVLFINPNNQNAKQGLKTLSGGSPAAKPSPAGGSAFDDVDFSAPAAGLAASAPFSGPAVQDTPSSVEWEAPSTETSSPSASPRAKEEPTAGEYDSWVASLNLKSTPSEPPSGAGLSSAFVTADDIFGPGFFDDEGDEKATAPAAPEEPAVDDQLFSASMDDGPFSVSAFDIPDADLPAATPASKPAVGSKMMSPGREGPAPTRDAASQFDLSTASAFSVDDDFEVGLGELDPSEYFQRIPTNIAATRLPGTVERVSPVLLLGLVVLIALNAGALVLLIGNLSS